MEKVFAEYRDDMETQRQRMETTLTVSNTRELKPTSRLRLTPSGVEAVIRFPVDYQNATEVDDRVTRELLKAIEHTPRLKLVASGTPTVQVTEVEPTKVPAA